MCDFDKKSVNLFGRVENFANTHRFARNTTDNPSYFKGLSLSSSSKLHCKTDKFTSWIIAPQSLPASGFRISNS